MHFYDLLTAYITIILLYMRAIGNNLHCGVTEFKKHLENRPSKTHRHSARRGLRRVSRTADHSTRAGSTIGSPAYVGEFEWSMYVGRTCAPSLKTSFGRSPRDHAKWYQKKCREDTRTPSGFVIARKKYFSTSSASAPGLRLDRIDFSVSSLQCLPSANANRSTS